MEEEELWKEIPFNKKYLVSNQGVIVSKKRMKPLKFFKNSSGYYRVTLCGITIRKHFVHRIVCGAFNPNDDPIKRPDVNHKDGNKENNKASNLEWMSKSENIKHAYRTGLMKSGKK